MLAFFKEAELREIRRQLQVSWTQYDVIMMHAPMLFTDLNNEHGCDFCSCSSEQITPCSLEDNPVVINYADKMLTSDCIQTQKKHFKSLN